MLLKVPYFEKYCPLNKKEPAEGPIFKSAKNGINSFLSCQAKNRSSRLSLYLNFIFGLSVSLLV